VRTASAARSSRTRRGFSLASVLLLTTVVAILLAAMRAAYLDEEPDEEEMLGLAAGFSLLAGAIVGAALGAAQQRPVLGVVIGMPIGVVAGFGAGMLLFLSGGFAVLGAGSVLVVLLAAGVRFMSGRTPKP